jgi:hypothetical protein
VYGIIYKIENLVNGKIYIGQTIQEGGFDTRYGRVANSAIEKVYLFHEYKRQKHKTHNRHLLGAIKQYGFENFKVDKVWDTAKNKNELNKKEKYWIKFYDSYNNGYNKTLGGEGHGGGKLDEKWKNSISESCKGRILTNETKNKISNSLSKNIICLNNYQVFNSISEGENIFGISKFQISKCCRRTLKRVFHKITKEPYVFLYYDDYLKLNDNDLSMLINDYIHNNIIKNSIKYTYKQVFCINTNEIFESAKQASKKYNITSYQTIELCCGGKLKSAGKLPETGERLLWMYYDEYLIHGNKSNIYSKSIICLNTFEIFDFVKNASQKYNIKRISSISECCKGKRYSTGKHPETGEPLRWMYYEDYIAQQNNKAS